MLGCAKGKALKDVKGDVDGIGYLCLLTDVDCREASSLPQRLGNKKTRDSSFSYFHL